MKKSLSLLSYEYGLLGEVKKETRFIKHIRNYLNKEESAVMEYTSDYLGRMQEITYPDGEVLTYSYDRGGQVTGVSGRVYGFDLTYVKDIQYDEYGQRTRIEYGNGAVTDYTYDEHRRWLSSLHTDSRLGETLQNLSYSFDRVGNVLGYTNDCLDEAGNYTTAQSYTYDGLYQLTSATGESVYNPHRGGVPDYKTTYIQNFTFDTNGLGKMMSKTSSMTVSQGKTLGGDGLVYDLDYEYDGDFVHRLKRAGDRTYTYDANGRLLEEKEGETENSTDTVRLSRTVKKETENVYSQDYGWGLSNDATREAQKADAAMNGTSTGSASGTGNTTGSGSSSGFRRTYTWDEKGRLTATSDSNYDVEYVYGEDNQRAVKTSDMGETLYFNTFWVWSNNSAVYNGSRTAKHIFLNNERIVTKLNSANNPTYSEESASTYYYHSDHLGSASVISDNDGREYERIEYTPYGDVWIDKASATYRTPYRFTGKERDEETGLYYFGERYLDAKVSRWLSCDSALGEYMVGSSVGCGGAYNSVNLNLYHYAGNNSVKYTDPTGMWIDHEDGTSTAQEGDTLWDKYGADWKEKSGFDRDPRTLQVGETVGKKNTTSANSTTISQNESKSRDNELWDLYVDKSNDCLTRALYTKGMINNDIANNGQLNLTVDIGIAEYGFQTPTLSLFGGNFQASIDGTIGSFTGQGSIGIKDFAIGVDGDISMLKISGTVHLSIFGKNSKIACEGILGGFGGGKRYGFSIFSKYAYGLGGSISIAPEDILNEKK